MITLETADKALKSVYLEVVGNQLNISANPLLTKIKQTTNNVYGNEIRKATSFGASGGFTAAGEQDELPTAVGTNYTQFVSKLKNLYGTLEISDKAIRCSQNSAGAFVNLLNAEMEALIKSSSFNLGRMLYSNGMGIIARINQSTEVGVKDLHVDSTRYLIDNMMIRIINKGNTAYSPDLPFKITHIDRTTNTITVDRETDRDMVDFGISTVKGFKNELTGIEALFDDMLNVIYGISKKAYPWMKSYHQKDVGAISEAAIQKAIDSVEFESESEVDFIACSAGVRRAFQEEMSSFKRNIDVMNLQGGFKAISYNGIPLVSDRFAENGAMYLLSTKNFELCQLCDWQWIEDSEGKIIRQKAGYPIYTATLVKYAELMCGRPNGQAKLSGITEA